MLQLCLRDSQSSSTTSPMRRGRGGGEGEEERLEPFGERGVEINMRGGESQVDRHHLAKRALLCMSLAERERGGIGNDC